MAQQQYKQQQENRALAPIEHLAPSRLPITQAMMQRVGVDDGMWRVLTDFIFPTARSVEGIKLALDYCKSRKLDILMRPVHVVPMWSTAAKKYIETVWPSIMLFRVTAHRTGEYAGIDKATFGPMIEREFVQIHEDERDPRNNREVKRTISYPEWCEIVVYRFVKGEKCSFSATVHWTEIYATANRNSDMPNDVWLKRPRGQLEKCAEAAALRRAFTEELGNEYVADEMEGKVYEGEFTRVPAGTAIGSQSPAGETIQSAQGGVKGAAPTNGQPPVGAAPTSNQVEKNNTVDAEVEEIDPADEPFNFEELKDRLAEAPDEATVKEIWEHFGIDSLFIDSPLDMTIALKVKQSRLKQIKAEQGGGAT